MFRKTGFFLLKVIGAAYLGLVVMVLFTIPLRFVTDNGTAVNVVSAILCDLGSMVCLFVLCIKDGYDDNAPGQQSQLGKTVICMVIAVAVYDLLTIIFGYRTGAATNVVYVVQAVWQLGASFGLGVVGAYPGPAFLSLLLQTIPFIPAMIAGYLVGGRKREKERQELKKQ